MKFAWPLSAGCPFRGPRRNQKFEIGGRVRDVVRQNLCESKSAWLLVQIPAFSCDCSNELCSASLLCAKLISHVVTSKRLAAQLPPQPYCPLGTAAGWITVPERRSPLPNSRSSGSRVLT